MTSLRIKAQVPARYRYWLQRTNRELADEIISNLLPIYLCV